MLRFYHASGETPAALDALLPPLLTKILSTGQQVALVVPDDARAERLNETLWTYSATSFLPHGRLTDGPTPAQHPILLLTTDELTSNPQPTHLHLFLAGTETLIPPAAATNHPMLCYLFFSAPTVLATARSLFKALKEAGTPPEYFQQVGTGWAKK